MLQEKMLHMGLFSNSVTPGGVGSSHRARAISLVVLHVFRDSTREAGGMDSSEMAISA